MPNLSDTVNKFGVQWAQWWHSLHHNAKGRPIAEGQYLNPVRPEDLTTAQPELTKGGPNGIFLLLVSLEWWGMAVVDKDLVRIGHYQ